MMHVFTISRTVEGRYWTKTDRQFGHPYVEDHMQLNELIYRIKLFGITIWKCRIDQEEVPFHVLADNALGGHIGSWRSKFHDRKDVEFYKAFRYRLS